MHQQQFALSASQHPAAKMMESGHQWVDGGSLPSGTPSGFVPQQVPSGFPIAPTLSLPLVSPPQSTSSPTHSQHYSQHYSTSIPAPDRVQLVPTAHHGGYPQLQPQPQHYHQFQQQQPQQAGQLFHPPPPPPTQQQQYQKSHSPLYGQQQPQLSTLQTSVPAVQPQLQLLSSAAAAGGAPLVLLSPGQPLYQLASPPMQLNTAAGSPIMPQFVMVQSDHHHHHSGSGSTSMLTLESAMPASVVAAVQDATRCVEQVRSSGMPLPPAPGHPETGAPLQKVLVKHIGQDITDAQIRQIFATCGSVHTARIAREQGTRRSLGFGFVEYNSTAEAALAVACLNRLGLEGKRLRVVWADRPPAPRLGH